jgi:hypothetical protein
MLDLVIEGRHKDLGRGLEAGRRPWLTATPRDRSRSGPRYSNISHWGSRRFWLRRELAAPTLAATFAFGSRR